MSVSYPHVVAGGLVIELDDFRDDRRERTSSEFCASAFLADDVVRRSPRVVHLREHALGD